MKQLVSAFVILICAICVANSITISRDAADGDFPWHVSISFFDKSNTKRYCGGSILSHKWVLTAAHCVAHRKTLTLGFGSTNLHSPAETIESNRSYQHPGYYYFNPLYDVALIELPKNLTFSKSIQPIQIPSVNENDTFVDQIASLSGFGRRSYEGNISSTLQVAQLLIISNEKCNKTYGKRITQPSILCTVGGSELQSPCRGDSGGPLVLQKEGKWIQIGVMVFIPSGNNCSTGEPAAYIRVTSTVDWITDEMMGD